ncbi:MAG TPA: Na+/H+ antiporter [Thermoleophilaceae bacterium]
MEHVELVVFGLLVAIAALAVIARLVRVPYPIVLVIGGSLIGFVPGVPSVELDPDLVLLIFLPPLLYGAAFFTSLRELRRDWRPILLLSTGLVFATMCAVALVAHEVVGLDWAEAFVLGAIVSPTDAVAPAEIMRRVGAPRRILAVIEGENLTNDWTALVFYRFAVAAVVTGSFSLAEASVQFLVNGLAGLAIGLVAGWLIRQVRMRIDDPPTEITISLLSGYAAYLPAEELGVSGVIAAVTVGVYVGWYTPQLTTPLMRMQGQAFWEILLFLLNAVLFVLVGLQLPTILDNIAGPSTGDLIWWAAAVSAAVILVRLVWGFTIVYVVRVIDRAISHQARRTRAGERLVVGWAGMRGAVSLAAALALPLHTDAGVAFPARDLIIFLAYAVLLVTLVGQGLTLGPLIHLVRLKEDDSEEQEEVLARTRTAEAALARLSEITAEEWVRDETAERVRQLFDYRLRRFSARAEGDGAYEERADAYRRLMYEVFDAQREALILLRNEGAISEAVRRRVERELDLDESRIGGF